MIAYIRSIPKGRIDNSYAIATVILAYAAGDGFLPWVTYPLFEVGVFFMWWRLLARWDSEV